MTQIEVEFIGEISKEKFLELKNLFEKEGNYKKHKERLSLLYFKDKIPKDIEEIQDELIDLRFRITNKEPEIVLKYGQFSGTNTREEIILKIKREEIENYIRFLNLFGWNIGTIYCTKTIVYEYKGVEFSLVEIKDYGHNFEAEILSDQKFVENAKRQIEKILESLSLTPFDKKGLYNQCNKINSIKKLQFDFGKQSFNRIKKRFANFF